VGIIKIGFICQILKDQGNFKGSRKVLNKDRLRIPQALKVHRVPLWYILPKNPFLCILPDHHAQGDFISVAG